MRYMCGPCVVHVQYLQFRFLKYKFFSFCTNKLHVAPQSQSTIIHTEQKGRISKTLQIEINSVRYKITFQSTRENFRN